MRLLICFLAMLFAASAVAEHDKSWTTAHEPFRVIGNVYYVGSEDLASYLVVTKAGLILVNPNLASSVPQIQASVEKLGFRVRDIKVILNSQAHLDHVEGMAAMKRLTGAKVEVMDADVSVMESGGRTDFRYGAEKDWWYEPVKVDVVLHDGDIVRLGGVEMTAHKTAGHTKGCTTWTMKVSENGVSYDVVMVGGVSANPGYKLKGDAQYPEMIGDFRRTFQTLKGLPCDVFLGAHGGYFGMEKKYKKLQAGDRLAFVDQMGLKAFVVESEKEFEEKVRKGA